MSADHRPAAKADAGSAAEQSSRMSLMPEVEDSPLFCCEIVIRAANRFRSVIKRGFHPRAGAPPRLGKIG